MCIRDSDGTPAIIIDVAKARDADALRVLDGVAALVAEETARLPDTITVAVVQDVTSIIRDRLLMLVQNGVIGLVLVIGVMSLFFRPGFAIWAAMGLPVAFAGAFIWMALTGLSLNMMTLVALLMAIGIVMDDSIVIEAKLHHTSSVSFDLNNVEPESVPFKAFFSADSPLEFNVFPATGDLAPYGTSEGTTFIVSFTPEDYGRTSVGTLFIQTDEMLWSYEVRGTHPAYAKPSLDTSKSKIDTGLTRAQLRAMQGKRTRARPSQ